jgi:alginate O-acetyltransferase complex protein AlgJ
VSNPAGGYLPERWHPTWFGAALVAFFVTVLSIGLIGSFFDRTELAGENRRPAALPGAPSSVKDWLAFPGRFEHYFNDQFGLRDRLLTIDHWIKAAIFGVSSAPTVLVGKQGWLYFTGEDGKALDRWYRGIGAFTDADIETLRVELLRRREYLDHLGIAYVVVVVPEKYSVYPEFLPEWVSRVAATSALDRIADDLSHHPELHFIDLRAALRDSKQRERVYYKTDSHWNFLGASVGYRVLSSEIGRLLPGFSAVPPRRPPFDPKVDFYSGDLSRMIDAERRFREDDIAPVWKVIADESSRCARRAPAADASGVESYVYACPNAPRYRALVYRDSMAIPLIPLLSENFARTTYVSSRAMDPALVLGLRPDIVVEEMVERTLNAPAAFPLNAPTR